MKWPCAVITVETTIAASIERCFDLARNVRIHEQTTRGSAERVVECTREMLELGDVVTFEAKHVGVRQRLTSKIIQFDSPHQFTDEMVHGAFKRLRHVHGFKEIDGGLS